MRVLCCHYSSERLLKPTAAQSACKKMILLELAITSLEGERQKPQFRPCPRTEVKAPLQRVSDSKKMYIVLKLIQAH